MTADPLSPDVSARICKHMNDDHPEALIEFAKRYAKVINPQKAKMTYLSPTKMELKGDERTVQISFDHRLTDSNDAHQTLVSMLKRTTQPK